MIGHKVFSESRGFMPLLTLGIQRIITFQSFVFLMNGKKRLTSSDWNENFNFFFTLHKIIEYDQKQLIVSPTLILNSDIFSGQQFLFEVRRNFTVHSVQEHKNER